MNKRMLLKMGLAALLFSIVFTITEQLIRNGRIILLPTLILSLTVTFSTWAIWILFFRITSRNAVLPVSQGRKKIFSSFFLLVVATAIIALIFWIIAIAVLHLIHYGDLAYVYSDVKRSMPEVMKFLSVGLLITYGVFFYAIWQQAIKREQQLREENLLYKYKTLKSQVNPHFLFNSLNTISEIIYANPQQADRYIRKLAGIYRYILDHEESDQVPLNQEIKFIQTYFDLQKERLGDKIKLNIHLHNTDTFRIIPISLQILLENALKHNAASANNPLVVDIVKDNGYVEVSNNIQVKKTLENLPGTGLANLGERVKLITGKQIIIRKDAHCFSVKLPLIVQEK